MAQTLYTRLLAQAAQIQGSTQAVASELRVPEATLQRWMSGRAQMPVQAFIKLIELIARHEAKHALAAPAAPAFQEDLTFKIGQQLARCAKCDGTSFRLDDAAPLRMTSRLACRECGEPVIHGNLIAQLAKEAVNYARALTKSRGRRQVEIAERSRQRRAALNPDRLAERDEKD